MPTRIEQLGATPASVSTVATYFQYTAELGPGTYTRANILALMPGASSLIRATFGVNSGTMDFTRGGTVTAAPVGFVWELPNIAGVSIADFSVTVNASSSVLLDVTAV